MSEIPNIDVTLTKDNIDSVVSAVVAVVKPHWNLTDTKTEIMQAGYLNIVILCRPHASKDKQDAIIIKTANEYYCGPIAENKVVWSFMSKQNLGIKILGFINNGMCMEVVKGEMMHLKDKRLYEENVWKKIAEELARWHRRDVLKAAIQHGVRRQHILYSDTAVARYPLSFLIPDNERQRHRYPTHQQLVEDEKFLRERLLARGDLEEAFCHLDLNTANISVYTEKAADDTSYTYGIQLIDYDMTGIGYTQVEIAWFFLTFVVPEEVIMDFLPDKKYQMNFLRHYLHHRRELEPGPDVTEDDVEKLYQQVDKAKLFIYLRFTMLGPTMVEINDGATNFVEFSAERWKEYQKLKVDVFAELK